MTNTHYVLIMPLTGVLYLQTDPTLMHIVLRDYPHRQSLINRGYARQLFAAKHISHLHSLHRDTVYCEFSISIHFEYEH